MDSVSATSMTFGLILMIFSWVQLMFISFKEDFSWGLATVFLPPLSYLYAAFDFQKNQAPIWAAAGGITLLVFSALS